MYLWEIPKTDNIMISFFLSGRKFNLTTSLVPEERPEKDGMYVMPIIVAGSVLHLDSRCENLRLVYVNQASKRSHIWNKDIRIDYDEEKKCYLVTSPEESIPENRRGAIRIPIGIQTDCTISLLNGKYPCCINDISVTGIGANIDLRIEDKKLMHRLIYTSFTDDILKKTFYIKGRIIHVAEMKDRSLRCGCEILNITPSINEYINVKQTYRLARAARYGNDPIGDYIAKEAELDMTVVKEIERVEAEALERAEKEAPKIPSFIKNPEDYKICPICEEGKLVWDDYERCFICQVCESMLEP